MPGRAVINPVGRLRQTVLCWETHRDKTRGQINQCDHCYHKDIGIVFDRCVGQLEHSSLVIESQRCGQLFVVSLVLIEDNIWGSNVPDPNNPSPFSPESQHFSYTLLDSKYRRLFHQRAFGVVCL